jgi:hypothetical protein
VSKSIDNANGERLNEAIPWLAEIILVNGDETAVSRPVNVLWETDGMLILQLPDANNGALFHVDRDLISVLVFDPP